MQSNNAQEASRLLSKNANPNERDRSGNTPLHYARTPEAINLLCRHGADIDAQGLQGNTPLHTAAISARLDCIKQLIGNGADKNKTNNAGYTPAWILIHAFQTGYTYDGKLNLPIREGSREYYIEALKPLCLPENLW
jgi:hypothetical protein